MPPPTLTCVQNGWNGTFTINNRGQANDDHFVERGRPFMGAVQLSPDEVRFYFNGRDPNGNALANHLMFSLVYRGHDDVLEIWWGGRPESNPARMPVSGASKVLLNIEEPQSGVLGAILLDDGSNNRFWKHYYSIAQYVHGL